MQSDKGDHNVNWFCNTIQTAFFRSSEGNCEASALWNLLSEQEPAMKFKEGMNNPMNYPGSLTGGMIEGHNVILGIQNKRVDLWITPIAPPQNQKIPPYIENTQESISFLHNKSDLIGSKEVCNRFGIVVNMVKFFKSNREATVGFKEYIKSESLIPESAKDILFRYNNVTDEGVDDFKFQLNNIIAVNTFTHKNINVKISNTNFSASTTTFNEYTCLGKNVDVNMVAVNSSIKKEHVNDIFNVMFGRIENEINS